MIRPPPRPTLFPYTTLSRSATATTERRPWIPVPAEPDRQGLDRKSTRLNSSHQIISYAVFCLKKKKKWQKRPGSTDITAILRHVLYDQRYVRHHVRTHRSLP